MSQANTITEAERLAARRESNFIELFFFLTYGIIVLITLLIFGENTAVNVFLTILGVITVIVALTIHVLSVYGTRKMLQKKLPEGWLKRIVLKTLGWLHYYAYRVS